MMTMWRVLGAIDTRQYDGGKAIPGSGEFVPCAHCGRDIAIHVTVAEHAVVEIDGLRRLGDVIARHVWGQDCVRASAKTGEYDWRDAAEDGALH